MSSMPCIVPQVAVANRKRPSILALSRQGMPNLPGQSADGVAKGAYIIKDAEGGKPDVILIGSGSELMLASEAAEKLEAEGKKVRGCWVAAFCACRPPGDLCLCCDYVSCYA